MVMLSPLNRSQPSFIVELNSTAVLPGSMAREQPSQPSPQLRTLICGPPKPNGERVKVGKDQDRASFSSRTSRGCGHLPMDCQGTRVPFPNPKIWKNSERLQDLPTPQLSCLSGLLSYSPPVQGLFWSVLSGARALYTLGFLTP